MDDDTSEVRIPLPQGGYALVERRDLPLVRDISWSLSSKGYVQGKTDDGKSVYMHVVILGARPGYSIDHINRVRTDNRRSNLRHATAVQQRKNQDRSYRAPVGTSIYERGGEWVAWIGSTCLGAFPSRADAHRAIEKARS